MTLQVGGLVNAFGNGMVIPFMFIYLHNVRGIALGVTGLIVAAHAVVSHRRRACLRVADRPLRWKANARVRRS